MTTIQTCQCGKGEFWPNDGCMRCHSLFEDMEVVFGEEQRTQFLTSEEALWERDSAETVVEGITACYTSLTAEIVGTGPLVQIRITWNRDLKPAPEDLPHEPEQSMIMAHVRAESARLREKEAFDRFFEEEES